MEKTTIRDILSNEQREEILITALEQHIKKCKGIANGKIVGERAEEKWNKLSKADKLQALHFIKQYNSSVIKQGIAKAYPTTYLNQKRWEK